MLLKETWQILHGAPFDSVQGVFDKQEEEKGEGDRSCAGPGVFVQRVATTSLMHSCYWSRSFAQGLWLEIRYSQVQLLWGVSCSELSKFFCCLPVWDCLFLAQVALPHALLYSVQVKQAVNGSGKIRVCCPASTQ